VNDPGPFGPSCLYDAMIYVILIFALIRLPFNLSATEYHLGLLKGKLARLRQQLLEPTGKGGAKVGVCGEI